MSAALRTYATTWTRDAPVPVAPYPGLFEVVATLRALLRDDAVAPCTERLKGDLTINHIVITRNAGSSIARDRSTWSSP